MTHYHFENRFIVKDDEGNIVQDVPWNPDETSFDAVQCVGCKYIFRKDWEDEECACTDDEEGAVNPGRIDMQAVQCHHCSESILALEYVEHLSDCMSY